MGATQTQLEPGAPDVTFSRSLTVSIDAPPEVVFAYLADLERHGEWSSEPLDITLDPGVRPGVGATYTSVARAGFKVTGQIRVVRMEPPVRLAYECRDFFGDYRWWMILDPAGAGTRLTYRMERLRAPFLIALIQPWLMWPLLGRRSVGNGAKRLKARLEAGVAPRLA